MDSSDRKCLKYLVDTNVVYNVINRNRVQNYNIFFIFARRHAKVTYLQKSRNCVNTGQKAIQKNEIIFISIFSLKYLVNFGIFCNFAVDFNTHVYAKNK